MIFQGRIAELLLIPPLVFSVVLLSVAGLSCLAPDVTCRIGVDATPVEALLQIAGGTYVIVAVTVCVVHFVLPRLRISKQHLHGALPIAAVAVITALPFLGLAAVGLGSNLVEQIWLLLSVSLAGLSAGLTYKARM